MTAGTLVSIAETWYVGYLGTMSLAGIALVFPCIMLQQMLSAGSMGGGISSAVSRALGAKDLDKANALVLHAALICLGMGFPPETGPPSPRSRTTPMCWTPC
jgi:Na+-driven multidrug efflux pump